MSKLEVGDIVVMNDRYEVPETHREVEFEVESESFFICNTECVSIQCYRSGYPVDGLDIVRTRAQENKRRYNIEIVECAWCGNKTKRESDGGVLCPACREKWNKEHEQPEEMKWLKQTSDRQLAAATLGYGDVRMLDMEKEIETLKAENARLTEQMKNAVVLPCKVGDTVYADKNTLRYTSNLSQKFIAAKIMGFTFGRQKMFKIKYETLEEDGYIIHGYQRFPFSAIGKTIFLTIDCCGHCENISK